jgi:serine/threonine protein kinase
MSPGRILFQLFGALAYAHTCGVNHNDIKPGNILFDPRRGVVVCDWGLSSVSRYCRYLPPDIQSGSRESVICGTSWYLCPEAATGLFPESSRDIFAVGVLALWLLGFIILPECLSKYLFSIHKMHIEASTDMHTKDRWIDLLSGFASRMGDEDICEKLTRQMLQHLPHDRPSAIQLQAQMHQADPSLAEPQYDAA